MITMHAPQAGNDIRIPAFQRFLRPVRISDQAAAAHHGIGNPLCDHSFRLLRTHHRADQADLKRGFLLDPPGEFRIVAMRLKDRRYRMDIARVNYIHPAADIHHIDQPFRRL